MKALVVGGGGPTGSHIVAGLRARGYQTAVLNRGVHPVDLPDDVERIVGDPHFLGPLADAIGPRSFDLVVGSYGRLAVLAEAFAGRAGRFIGVGGWVSYRGFFEPQANHPAGLPVPTPETWPLVTDPEEHRFAALVAAAEQAVFRHHPDGTVFRYPYVYGPRQLVPREWSVVRRVLDGRRTIAAIHGGLGLMTHGYAENLAHTILLAVDNPRTSAGKAYNCGDDVQLDLRQFIEVAAGALGAKLEVIPIPDTPALHALSFTRSGHLRLMDTSRIRADLGYRDLVPSVEAVARTARWYADHPLERGGEIERKMFDFFDYAAEDRLTALYRDFEAQAAALPARPMHDIHPYAHPDAAGTGRDQRGR
jgi:nucleoside-diphosphate-sugar epimerase